MTQHIRERARALQAEHYKEGEADSESARLATRLYDEIDALSERQRALLVTESAGYTKGVLQRILATNDLAEIKAMSLIGLGLLGVTCYANESNREDAGDTTNGDRLVDGVMETVRAMTNAQTGELLPEDQRALADEINAKVEERVNAGESADMALMAELEAHREQIEAMVGKPAAAASQGEESSGRYETGLYL